MYFINFLRVSVGSNAFLIFVVVETTFETHAFSRSHCGTANPKKFGWTKQQPDNTSNQQLTAPLTRYDSRLVRRVLRVRTHSLIPSATEHEGGVVPLQTAPVLTQRRNQVSRACTNCSTAHTSCDESHPCQRCTNRGHV